MIYLKLRGQFSLLVICFFRKWRFHFNSSFEGVVF
jgi:hypothetical protein